MKKNSILKYLTTLYTNSHLKKKLLIHVEVCNVKNTEQDSFSSMLFFFDNFTIFLKEENSSLEIEALQKALRNLQLQKILDSIKNEELIDTQWVLIEELKKEI